MLVTRFYQVYHTIKNISHDKWVVMDQYESDGKYIFYISHLSWNLKKDPYPDARIKVSRLMWHSFEIHDELYMSIEEIAQRAVVIPEV